MLVHHSSPPHNHISQLERKHDITTKCDRNRNKKKQKLGSTFSSSIHEGATVNLDFFFFVTNSYKSVDFVTVYLLCLDVEKRKNSMCGFVTPLEGSEADAHRKPEVSNLFYGRMNF